jgi:hypothetical protein
MKYIIIKHRKIIGTTKAKAKAKAKKDNLNR